ncbi:hypothetical protein D3C76_1579060 [compost metagenome]
MHGKDAVNSHPLQESLWQHRSIDARHHGISAANVLLTAVGVGQPDVNQLRLRLINPRLQHQGRTVIRNASELEFEWGASCGQRAIDRRIKVLHGDRFDRQF